RRSAGVRTNSWRADAVRHHVRSGPHRLALGGPSVIGLWVSRMKAYLPIMALPLKEEKVMADVPRTVLPEASTLDQESTEADEVEEVLTARRELIHQVVNPVVRACLEEVCADITHLTGDGDPPNSDQDQRARQPHIA